MKIFAILLLFICVGCQHQVIPATEANSHEPGVRFYEPEPHLAVGERAVIIDGVEEVITTKEGPKRVTERVELHDKKIECSIVYLPNPRAKYLIRNADPKEIILKDGWRFEGFESYDQSIKNQQTKAFVEVLTGTEGLKPGLYRFVRDSSGNITHIKKIIVSQ